MSRRPTLAALLATTLVAGAPAGTPDEAHLADLVTGAARWLARAEGFAELRETAHAANLLREVVRLSLVRSRGDAELVERVLAPVHLATEATPADLGRQLAARADALSAVDRLEFYQLVARLAPGEEATDRERRVSALLAEGAPPSPFTPIGPDGGRVATDAQLHALADSILETLWQATGTRREPDDLPLDEVADRLLEP